MYLFWYTINVFNHGLRCKMAWSELKKCRGAPTWSQVYQAHGRCGGSLPFPSGPKFEAPNSFRSGWMCQKNAGNRTWNRCWKKVSWVREKRIGDWMVWITTIWTSMLTRTAKSEFAIEPTIFSPGISFWAAPAQRAVLGIQMPFRQSCDVAAGALWTSVLCVWQHGVL